MVKNEQASRSMLLGTYESDVQDAFCRYVKPGDIVWDIGANLGFFTLLTGRLRGRIIAVEPIPENRSYLQSCLDLNPGFRKNVHVIPAAVAEKRGKGILALEKRGKLTFARAFLSDRADNARKEIEVDVVTLDDLCLQFGPPNVIKMDIEGGEYKALIGAERLLLEHKPRFLLEFHGDDIALMCLDLLKRNAYDQFENLPHSGICQFVVASSSARPT